MDFLFYRPKQTTNNGMVAIEITRTKRSNRKIMTTIFWNLNRISLLKCVPNEPKINSAMYGEIFTQLNRAIKLVYMDAEICRFSNARESKKLTIQANPPQL